MKDEVLKERCDFYNESLFRGFVLQEIGEERGLLEDRDMVLIREHLKNCKYCSFCMKEIKNILQMEKIEIDRKSIEKSKTNLLEKMSNLVSSMYNNGKIHKIISFFDSTTGFLTFISFIVIMLVLPFIFFYSHSHVGSLKTLGESVAEKGKIVVVSPLNKIDPQGEIIFKWYPVLGAEKYKIKIFDGNGNILFSASTRKAKYKMNGDERIIFLSGKKFFWQVEALNIDDEVIEKSKKIVIVPEEKR